MRETNFKLREEQRPAGERMLDGFFAGTGPVRSFRECYVFITGDRKVTGKSENCDFTRMRETIGTTDFASVLGESLRRAMVADYRKGSRYSVWKNLVQIGPNITDFRTQERTRYGGYGDLPAVAEGDPYVALTSPEDEKATYAVSKRGGTETITLEAIKADDVGAISRIPKRLAEAADRTLGKFVLDFLRANPVIFDSVALFHATHNNLGNAALSAVGLAAARAALKRQTELGSGDALGLEPRYLWVPFDLEETGQNLFRRNTNQDRTFVQDLNIDVIPVWYWTDADDWCLSASPDDCPTIEIGFLDGNQDPDLFLQDSPSVGSMFASDQVTYKIRHIYGGTVVDFRGIYKSVV